MVNPVGGKLLRLVDDNFFNYVEDGLDQLGWFDPGRQHKPVTLLPEPLEGDAAEPNLVTISLESIRERDIELGSRKSEHRIRTYIDVYGESKALSLHLIGDIKDIIDGRTTSIGYEDASFEVFDLSDPLKPMLFVCHIENIKLDRERFYSTPHQKYWWFVEFDLCFTYHDDVSGY